MKKLIVSMAALLLLVGLVGCGSAKKADGVYTAEADDAYVNDVAYGWRDTLVLTYQDGAVVDAMFESYDAEGQKKSAPGVYEMDPPPADWIPQLTANVKEATSADTIDGIAGATMSSSNVRQLYAAIEKSGKPGETIQVSLKAES